MQNTDTKQIVGAIVLAGAMIAGAILVRGGSAPASVNPGNPAQAVKIAPIGENDNILGNPEANVAVVVYADFQCPFCGAISGLLPDDAPIMQALTERDPTWAPFIPRVIDYAKTGKVKLVYRDFPFLGPESFQSAEAARCADDQGKYMAYHDYLYSKQKGENEGAFSDDNLKLFAKDLGLDTTAFAECLDSNKYEQAVIDAKDEAAQAGVTGTPKGFILKKGKIVSTIDGAESATTVKQKLDSALK